jgi:hypothetical protein
MQLPDACVQDADVQGVLRAEMSVYGALLGRMGDAEMTSAMAASKFPAAGITIPIHFHGGWVGHPGVGIKLHFVGQNAGRGGLQHEDAP